MLNFCLNYSLNGLNISANALLKIISICLLINQRNFKSITACLQMGKFKSNEFQTDGRFLKSVSYYFCRKKLHKTTSLGTCQFLAPKFQF